MCGNKEPRIKQPFHFEAGYRYASHRYHVWSNRLMAALVLLLSLPFFILLPLLIKLQDGGPVFYRGARLGKNKQLFTMYKFRTLVVDAENILGSNLLNAHHKLETPIGKFLRDSRLDELPQLWNVLRGDMDLIGPRPERPSVYQDVCTHIKGYDKRFLIKPGLIGYSQLWTPHNTPKKTRTLIDNHYLQAKHRFRSDITLFSYAICILALKLISLTLTRSLDKLNALVQNGSFFDKRQFTRLRPKKAYVYFYASREESLTPLHQGRLKDINDRDLAVILGTPLEIKRFHVKIVTRYQLPLQSKARYKSVHCDVDIINERVINPELAPCYHYVLRMQPLSPLNLLKLHKYFLKKSIL